MTGAPSFKPVEVLPYSNPLHLVGAFAAFAVINRQLRVWYSRIAPGVITSSIPTGVDDSSGDNEVEQLHALIAFVIFTAACVFNLNAALWSQHASRNHLNLQVAYISAVASLTHWEMYRGKDWYVTLRGPTNNRVVSQSGLRQLEWIFATPVLLLLVQDLHAFAYAALPPVVEKKKNQIKVKKKIGAAPASSSGGKYKPVNKVTLVVADLAMILMGWIMPMTSGVETVALYGFAACCFVFVIFHSVRALLDIISGTSMDYADAGRVASIGVLKVVAWAGYPAIYFLTDAGIITCKRQHELYLINDVLTKFSYTLIISTGALRFIEVLEERRRKVAIQLTQVQRAFFFNITHELRTPLNSIIGFNTLAMESGELTEFTGSFIKASLTSAEALLGLINQILDFAKFEGAKDKSGGSESSIELSEDVWTLRQLVEQVTDISQKASSSGVDLVMNIASPEHFNTKFVGDFFRLRQCCVNLVDNAIKYSSNVKGRTALVEFTMTLRPDADNGDLSAITFCVEDNGVGIPTAKQHALFVPFCQPAEHKTAKEKGTGLGLVITKSIIDCMGGEIDFESVEDEFTKFFFTISFPKFRSSNNGAGSVDGDAGGAGKDSLDDEADTFRSEDEASLMGDSLPSNVRLIFHPAMRTPTRKHVTCILKCFKGKAGVNYVSIPSADHMEAKVKQASKLGVPVVLTDVDNVNDTLKFIQETPNAGVVVIGLPYQLIALNRQVADLRNVATVLKPVKPSDLLRAVYKLSATSNAGMMEWMYDSIGEDEDTVKKFTEATENASDNTFNNINTGGGGGGGGGGSPTAGAARASGAEPASVGATIEPEGAGELQGMNVLLVEDNVMNQQMAKFSIIKCGATLQVAGHGQYAVDFVKDRFERKLPNYDCILMDMMMPVMDGATATVEIRKLEKEFGIQEPHTIVGLSANVGPEYTEQIKKAGMNGSMSKPFYPATLRNTLANVFKGTYEGFSRTSTTDASVEDKPGN